MASKSIPRPVSATAGTRSRFSVVTPCRNAGAQLEHTLHSVRNQTAVRAGEVELQHIIIDGASTDATAEIVRRRGDAAVEFVSEPDGAMYEALAKGLRRATGHWITYLNAGDLLDERAFETIVGVERTHDVAWITGRSTMNDDRGRLARDRVPFRYRRSLILAGQYCRRPPLFLPFLQQEGTFWRRELNDSVDLETLSRFKLAGDYYLWRCFAAVCEPTVVANRLGIFQRHAGQLSENRAAYHAEVAAMGGTLTLAEGIRGAIDAVLWYTPAAFKKKLNPRRILVLDEKRQIWR